MKKQKKPVVLLTIICVVVAGAMVVNASNVFKKDMGGQHTDEHMPDEELTARNTTADDKKNAAEALKNAAKPKDEEGRPRPKAVDGTEGPYTPSILLPETKVVQPIMNEGTTVSQWYDSDSYQQKLNEEKKKDNAGLSGS